MTIAGETRRRTRRAAIYVRISDDRISEGLGVGRQEADGRALIERLGWRFVDLYCDNDVSAYSGKKRPEYERMIQAIRDEEIDAIVAWHPDRLHRSPKELESFIDLAEEYGIAIQTVQAGEWDLSTPSGRAVARTLGAWARYESEHKSVRVRRKIQELVEDGKISSAGARPYGYRRVYDRDERPRKILREELDPIEAPVIREMATRALNLESLHSLVHDLRRRGIKTAQGNEWERMPLKRILTSARIAGLRSHNDQIVGQAPWPAIITPEEHERLVALFPYKRDPNGGRKPRRWPSSGLVYCTCGARMKSTNGRPSKNHHRRDTPAFVCPTPAKGGCGSRSISTAHLEGSEGLLKTLFLAHLEELEAAPETDRQAALEAQIAGWEDRLEELEGELLDGARSVRAIRKATDELHERIEDARRQLGALGVRREVTTSVAELRASWDDLPIERRGSLYRAYIERIIIFPKGKGGNVFDPSRVVVEWR